MKVRLKAVWRSQDSAAGAVWGRAELVFSVGLRWFPKDQQDTTQWLHTCIYIYGTPAHLFLAIMHRIFLKTQKMVDLWGGG